MLRRNKLNEKQQLIAQLSELISNIDNAISDAEEFAIEHGLSFTWDGPSYGMGGSFDGRLPKDHHDRDTDQTGPQWYASSLSC